MRTQSLSTVSEKIRLLSTRRHTRIPEPFTPYLVAPTTEDGVEVICSNISARCED